MALIPRKLHTYLLIVLPTSGVSSGVLLYAFIRLADNALRDTFGPGRAMHIGYLFLILRLSEPHDHFTDPREMFDQDTLEHKQGSEDGFVCSLKPCILKVYTSILNPEMPIEHNLEKPLDSVAQSSANPANRCSPELPSSICRVLSEAHVQAVCRDVPLTTRWLHP